MSAQTLTGSGLIRAAGGNGSGFNSGGNSWGFGGGGGGGRIAVFAPEMTDFDTTHISAPGGARAGGDPVQDGLPGTVHIVQGQPHTHVRLHSPTGLPIGFVGKGNGYVDRPIDSITLSFNKLIDLSTFPPSAFEITGQMGQVVPTAVTLVGDRTYRIDLPFSLTESGTYHFRLPPTVKDVEGFPLDQNANGIPGETADEYVFDLILDTVPPRITPHTLAEDVAGTIGSVDVWFSEPIDKATFTAADITITRPDNQSVGVSIIQEVGFNRFRINFAPQTLLGVYHVRIGPDVRDLAGNKLDIDLDGVFGEPVQDVYEGRSTSCRSISG